MAHQPMFSEAPKPLSQVDYLNAAAEAVRGYCGWHVTPDRDETLVLDDDGTGTFLLRSGHVTDVMSVRVAGADLDPSEYEWSEDGILRVPSCAGRGRLRSVEVAIRHGYSESEASAVLAVIRGAAHRAAMSPGGNLAYQAAGTQRVGFQSATGGGSNSLPLMQTEKDTLAPFKLTWGPR